MCSYLHRATNGGYHFRMAIPADLRPFMAGKREIKHSLKLKDRAAAKARIPDMTQAANALLDQAKLDRDTTGKLAPPLLSPSLLLRWNGTGDGGRLSKRKPTMQPIRTLPLIWKLSA